MIGVSGTVACEKLADITKQGEQLSTRACLSSTDEETQACYQQKELLTPTEHCNVSSIVELLKSNTIDCNSKEATAQVKSLLERALSTSTEE